ncbi:unnamed protein product [Arabidopsis halleri]
MHRPLPPNKPHHYIRRRSQPNPRLMAEQTCSQNRKSIVGIEKEGPSPNLHMPAGLLAKIVSYIGEEGIGELKNWIVSGREGMEAVLSPECLTSVRYSDIEDAIKVVATVKGVYPVAELLYIMLNSCAGKEDRVVYSKFKKRYNYEEAEQLCGTLRFHIKSLNPKDCGTYCETWCFSDSPVCWESHQFLDEYNGGPYIVERCIDCIYFYLSRDVMELS